LFTILFVFTVVPARFVVAQGKAVALVHKLLDGGGGGEVTHIEKVP
jgi:hypothetical protein